MTFRVAAKPELDADFTILDFNDSTLGMEIDQAGSSLLLSLSLLTACAYGFVASLGRSTIQTDTKIQKSVTSRISIVLHRAG